MTTKSLQSLIEKANALPADLQERLAKQWLAELEDEQVWDDEFARSQDILDAMAERALKNHRDGKTIAKGWDEI